jgi:hypothetical protein
MLGEAAVAMWWDIARERKAEFEDWHTHEHMPERLGIPGFLRGTRWIALSGEPSYFVLYEARRLSTVTAGPYLERLNNPTPWSRKMMPHHRNMVRSLCRVRASSGGGVAHALATVRFSPLASKTGSVEEWLSRDVLPALPARKGLAGAHLLQSEPASGLPQTTEQKIRGKDARADWVLLLTGYDAEALSSELRRGLGAEALEAHGASPGAAVGLFGLSYSLTPKDLR